eukprot:4664188-Prymnesium_polylepis.1
MHCAQSERTRLPGLAAQGHAIRHAGVTTRDGQRWCISSAVRRRDTMLCDQCSISHARAQYCGSLSHAGPVVRPPSYDPRSRCHTLDSTLPPTQDI